MTKRLTTWTINGLLTIVLLDLVIPEVLQSTARYVRVVMAWADEEVEPAT